MADADDPTVDPTQGTEDDDPWIGQTLAGYTILRRLGEGGMGIVYLAQHQSLDRLAAVKFLAGDMAANVQFVELFLREAKAAAKLAHPNIVGVHDAGVAGNNIYYFIMDYVEGRDLASILNELGIMPIAEAVEYVRQAASALAYAHKKDIIHRDIKPENLLLTSEGVIKVVDLGLAKWAGEEESMFTQSGDIMGSPIYISPERLRDPHTPDARSDIYSLGGTLYHLVTGRIPYEGSSAVMMARHLTDPVPDPRAVKPDLDDALAEIIMKMMAKDLGDRFRTMGEVEAALGNYQTSPQSGMEVAPKAVARETSGTERNNTLIYVAAVVLTVLIGGAFGYVYNKRKSVASIAPTAAPVAVPAPTPDPGQPAAEIIPVESFVIADFNADSRVNHVKGTFGAWGSSKPNPVGFGTERIVMNSGHDGSGSWRIEYDNSTVDSEAGIWMHLENFDATKYDMFRFRARSVDATIDFIVQLKLGPGGPVVVRPVTVRGVSDEWKLIQIPLKDFDLPELKPFYEFVIVMDTKTTGPRKGTLFIDDIEFIKMP